MYSFRIKADAIDIDVPTARSLLSFSVLVAILYRNENIFAVNIAVAVIIFIANLFAATLLVKFRINILLLVGVSAVLLAAATREILFPLLIWLLAFAVKYSYVQPTVDIADKGVRIKKSFHRKVYDWASFNNMVLKDGLLTLDFKNNKVLQLELADQADENDFNNFCAGKLSANNSNAAQNDVNR